MNNLEEKMKKTIDSFFNGHNEMDSRRYEKSVRQMGTSPGAYRDLNLSFVTGFHGESCETVRDTFQFTMSR